MNALKTVFWVFIAVALALFTMRNWAPVTVWLWGDVQLRTKLPALILLAFLLGWLPTMVMYWTNRWNHRRRLATVERHLAEIRSTIGPDPVPEPEPALPPSAQPVAPPPAAF
jgi:uncharacterized integral membrane protein